MFVRVIWWIVGSVKALLNNQEVRPLYYGEGEFFKQAADYFYENYPLGHYWLRRRD